MLLRSENVLYYNWFGLFFSSDWPFNIRSLIVSFTVHCICYWSLYTVNENRVLFSKFLFEPAFFPKFPKWFVLFMWTLQLSLLTKCNPRYFTTFTYHIWVSGYTEGNVIWHKVNGNICWFWSEFYIFRTIFQ